MAANETLDNMRIDVMKDGSYKVSGRVPLSIMTLTRNAQKEAIGWEEKQVLPVKDVYMLCRCGHSENKPYCDGNHVKENFDGTEVASKEPFEVGAKQIRGGDHILHDNIKFCVGAEFCDRLGGVWQLTEASEENCGLADPDDAAHYVKKAHQFATEEACLCPSGRLVMHRITEDGADIVIEPAYDKPGIALIEDPVYKSSGAIWVRGGIKIYDANGEPYETRNRVTLCRCGAS
ncbi:MAG: CDGSH iron-sulfur domain-containing protein, partial [Coriobacteriia bacterium]|nr:CDGSH iron-sulfur domain-containing protein [Coriobacteriia bacterium]